MNDSFFDLLGMKVVDLVTGYRGVVTSISFDLYGCVQGLVNHGLMSDGKLGEQTWFDVSRLEIMSLDPVMDRPDFSYFHPERWGKGPAEKPKCMKA